MLSLSTDSSMDISTSHCVNNVTSNHYNGTHYNAGCMVSPNLIPTIVLVITLLLSGILNSILVTVFCIEKRLHTTANAFIASLASAQILFSVFGCFNLVRELSTCITEGHIPNDGIQKAYAFVLSITVFSLYPSNFFISLERWAYIARPFSHQRMVSPRSTALTIMSVWTFAIFSSVDTLIKDYGSNSTEYRIRFQLALPCAHFLLCIILCIIYSHIAVITRRQVRAIQRTQAKPNMGNNDSLASLRTTWKNVRMLVIVFGSYFVLNTPYMVLQLRYAYQHYTEAVTSMGIVFVVTSQLSIMHYGATFFIYAYHDKDFRLTVKNLCRKLRCGYHNTAQVNPVAVNNNAICT